MAIQIMPVLEAISKLAGTAWQIYQNTNQAKVHDGLQGRVEKLENADREQARVLSDLAKELEQFAKATESQVGELERLGQALQGELAASQKREARARGLLYASLTIAVVSLALAVVALLK